MAARLHLSAPHSEAGGRGGEGGAAATSGWAPVASLATPSLPGGTELTISCPEVVASRSHTELTGPLCLPPAAVSMGLFSQALLPGPAGSPDALLQARGA